MTSLVEILELCSLNLAPEMYINKTFNVILKVL